MMSPHKSLKPPPDLVKASLVVVPCSSGLTKTQIKNESTWDLLELKYEKSAPLPNFDLMTTSYWESSDLKRHRPMVSSSTASGRGVE